MKIIICLVYCLSFYNSFSYSDLKVRPKDFINLTGGWDGTLTYIDYTTNKPFSMPVKMIVNDFKNSNIIICSLTYPKEPNANSLDTISISEDGKALNDERIKAKHQLNKDSLQIATEITGIDGNDHKAAIIRHTYILGKNSYSLRKETKSAGQTRWILRSVYKFSRTKP